MKPLCFVIMPFGIKKYKTRGSQDDQWVVINFDNVYMDIIHPAITEAGMEPIRADEEKVRGSIHKPMFERIMLCDYVVADLTGANANVFYEMGIRHAVKPHTTVSIFAGNSELPFDLAPFRTIPYEFSEENGLTNTIAIKSKITEALLESKTSKTTDSPIYQLVDGIKFQNSLAHEKTDIFREKVRFDQGLSEELRTARSVPGSKAEKLAALNLVVNEKISRPEDHEARVLIDAMLSYRDISAFPEMVQFIERIPPYIRQTIMVQEQYGFALNRTGNRTKAIEVLEKVIEENGPSSETCGILGRVYKDYITDHYEKNELDMATSYIDDAIAAYKKGFDADWRDAYPGINYVTCLELKGDRHSIARIIPVVEYAVLRKKEMKKPDYWDEATLAELAVIRKDYANAKHFLLEARKKNPVEWMLQTTAKNFIMIRTFRRLRGEQDDELDTLIDSIQVS